MYYYSRSTLLKTPQDTLDVSFYPNFERITPEIDDDNDEYRLPFWRDFQRLVSSPAYRRLKDKTQLFPGTESDFFRCRLTHSQEVAHIAKSITRRLNMSLDKLYKDVGYTRIHPYFSYIDTDLVEFACLAHDIGHAPFGHQGEQELNLLMKTQGGFEGNAQTLRIISRLEKKVTKTYYNKVTQREENYFDSSGFDDKGNDQRCGLNPTLRALASVLKYDEEIASKVGRLEKGYYITEKTLVDKVRESVGCNEDGKIRTVECQIMDIADDIAYSVYDLEDSLKAGFIVPLDFISVPPKVLGVIADKINDRHKKLFGDKEIMTSKIVENILFEFVSRFLFSEYGDEPVDVMITRSKNISQNGYRRSEFVSSLISYYISYIEIKFDYKNPAMSHVFIGEELDYKEDFEKWRNFLEIETLKIFNYEFQINSPRLKIVEDRGKEIVRTIFNKIIESDGSFLPPDIREIYNVAKTSSKDAGKIETKCFRIICDFVAGMTDSYALEYYGRLKSENAKSIYKPM